MESIEIRPVTDEEYPAFVTALIEGFSEDVPDDDFSDLVKSILPPERTLAAFDGENIVGTFGGYALELSVPGGSVPMEGTTVVTVFPTHRRTGLMEDMMRRHLDTAVGNGFPIAGLWASETGIYGRYGYGIASYLHTVQMQARDVSFRVGVDIGRVRRIDAEEARIVLPPVFDRVLAKSPGMYGRSAEWWKADVLDDSDWRKQGKTSMRIVVYDGSDGPDGYAIYRQKGDESNDGHANGTVHVVEIIAVTERAHTSLWSYLTRVDGCPTVKAWNTKIDDPLAMKLVEPRRVKIERRSDALWILILDVVAALEARSYEQDGTIRFTVENAFTADANGSYALSVKDGVGSCERITGETDIALDLDALGALYLGGGDAHAYAAATRIRGDVEAIHRLHGLFHTARAPWCNQVF